MIVVVIISVIALLLTWLEVKGGIKWGMGLAFVLLTIIEAIHYDFGNDYMSYLQTYDEITRYPFSLTAILHGDTLKEPGWEMLNYFFVYFGGFFGLVAFISIVQNIIYFRFIRQYVARSWWVMAVFIYLFNSSFYLLNMSMLRQGLAISLFVLALPYILNRKFIPAIIIILVAGLFHASARILIPFAFLGLLSVEGRTIKIIAISFVVLLISLFISQDLLQEIFMRVLDTGNMLESNDFANYTETYSQTGDTLTFGLGYIINLIPFIVTICYLLKNNESFVWQRRVACLALIATIIIPFAQIIPLISRISLYFSVFTIGSIPIVYKWIPKKTIQYTIVAIFIFMTLYDYYGFFHGSVYEKYYSTYHTIFSTM